jgi:hypothetical protein
MVAEKYTGSEGGSTGNFHQRVFSSPLLKPLVPKPIPSKWDDAEKWIRSPGHQQSPAHPQLWHLPVLMGSETGKPFLALKTSSHPTNANSALHENVVFLPQKAEIHATCVSKLCGFIHYIVQSAVFIVMCVTIYV